jgi:hypothetical protein
MDEPTYQPDKAPLSPRYDPAALDEILNTAVKVPLPPAPLSIPSSDYVASSPRTPEPDNVAHDDDYQPTPDAGAMPLTPGTLATDPVAALLALRDSAEARPLLRANAQTKEVSTLFWLHTV